MNRFLAALARGGAVSAAAALVAGPSFAVSIGTTVGVGPKVTAPPPVNPTPVTSLLRPIEHTPKLLDFGLLRSYRGEARAVELTLTAPNDGNLTAKLSPAGPFTVTRLIGYRRFLDPTTGRWRNQTVEGSGQLSVITGQKVGVVVTLKPTAETAGMPQANLEIYGRNWYLAVPARALVTHEPEIVAELLDGNVKLVPNGERTTTIRLNRTRQQSFVGPSGSDRSVTITARGLPPGITMEPVTVLVPVGVWAVDAAVKFQASPGTPVGWDQPITLLVDSVDDQETVELFAQVYPTSHSWNLSGKSGDVSYQGTFTINSDGTWRWTVHMEDDGTFFGDFYSLSLWLNVPLAPEEQQIPRDARWSRPTTMFSGTLGGGIFGGSTEADVDRSAYNDRYNAPGPNQWLREHYIEAYEAGFSTTCYASPDLGPMVEWFVETAWSKVGVDIDL